MNGAAWPLLLLLLLCAALALGQRKPKVTRRPTPTTKGSLESTASWETASVGEENKDATTIMSTETNDGSTMTHEEATAPETSTTRKEDKVFVVATTKKVRPHLSTTTDLWDEFTKEKCSGVQCFDAITLIIIIVAVVVGIFLIIISFVIGRKCCRGNSTQAKYSKIGEMYN